MPIQSPRATKNRNGFPTVRFKSPGSRESLSALVIARAGNAGQQQTITWTGTATAGTWTITVPSLGTTAAIAYNATAAQVQTALNAIGLGCSVQGGPNPTSFVVNVAFAAGNVGGFTIGTGGLTGSTAGVSITRAYNANLFRIRVSSYLTGKIIDNVPLATARGQVNVIYYRG